MKYSELIHEAWDQTVQTPKLKWFAFVPSFVAVLIFVMEVSWQLYLYSGEFEWVESVDSFVFIANAFRFLVENNLVGWVIFFVIFVTFFAFVVPSFVEGVYVSATRQKVQSPEKPLSLRQKLIESYDYFFRIFKFHAMSTIFSLSSIALFLATFYRYFHDSLFAVMWPVIVVYTILAFFVTIFWSFAPQFIVLEKCEAGEAARKSFSLVFLFFSQTLSLILLMFLVNFRIFINVLVILGVPLGIFAAIFYSLSSWVIVLLVILGVALMALVSYLTAIVEIFSTFAWTKAFLDLREKQKAITENEET